LAEQLFERIGAMLFKSLAVVSLIALVAVTGAIGGGQGGATVLQGILSGKAEAPKGDLDGAGTAKVTINGTKMCWVIKTTKVGALTAAHIHKGGARVAGPVVVAFGASYKPTGCVTAAAAVASAIAKNPKAYYVNVHDAEYPNGALRGQLVPNDETMR
jgi:CHRD domain